MCCTCPADVHWGHAVAREIVALRVGHVYRDSCSFLFLLHPYHTTRDRFHFVLVRVRSWPDGRSGVRVIAGALGDFPSVLDSTSLSEALGGLEAAEDASDSEDDSASSSQSAAKVSFGTHVLARLYFLTTDLSAQFRFAAFGKGLCLANFSRRAGSREV